ncbi:hypothetical protein AO265_26015 [Pseudomonas sp. ABAC61]|nr:hypothetical protein AO265_26015 [Pseudomonas sp. ABAC61]
MQGLLQRAGVRVVLAANGVEALQRLLEDGRFEGVLMDCQMPVMDGYATTRKIRGYPHLRSLPIIAVTASSQDDVQGRALAAGMSDLIGKPLEVSAFYRTLVRWIRHLELPAQVAANGVPEGVAVPSYAGIDSALGLAVVNQDLALHQKLLVDFRDEQQPVVERLWQAHAGGDFQAIGFMAHSLQGAAGNIGATQVRLAARQLEQQCAGQADLAPLIHQLAQCLEPLLASLAGLSEAAGVAPTCQAPLLDSRQRGQLQRLGKLLRNHDAQALALIDALCEQDRCPAPTCQAPLLDSRQRGQLQRLGKLLRNHDAQALALIDALCEQDRCPALREIREQIYRLEFQQAHELLVEWQQARG